MCCGVVPILFGRFLRVPSPHALVFIWKTLLWLVIMQKRSEVLSHETGKGEVLFKITYSLATEKNPLIIATCIAYRCAEIHVQESILKKTFNRKKKLYTWSNKCEWVLLRWFFLLHRSEGDREERKEMRERGEGQRWRIISSCNRPSGLHGPMS